MIGTWYIAAPKHGAAQWFRTPFDAMAALLPTEGQADIFVQCGDGPRERLMRRNAQGVWSTK